MVVVQRPYKIMGKTILGSDIPTADQVLTFSDPQWTAEDAGGGTEGVMKGTDETVNNSNVLQADDDIVIALEANSKYSLDHYFIVESTASADFQYNYTVPSGATGERLGGVWDADTITALLNITTADFVATGGAGVGIVGRGRITTTDAGNLVLNWAQWVAEATDTKLKAGSWVKVTKLG